MNPITLVLAAVALGIIFLVLLAPAIEDWRQERSRRKRGGFLR